MGKVEKDRFLFLFRKKLDFVDGLITKLALTTSFGYIRTRGDERKQNLKPKSMNNLSYLRTS